MRRGKRVTEIELPYEDPEVIAIETDEPIPVEIPEPVKVPVRREEDNG